MDDDRNDDELEQLQEDMVRLAVSLPLDRGFLRRSCPACAREFKRLGDQVNTSDEAASFTCPYCYESAPRDEWWTVAQHAYVEAVTYEKVLVPKLREFQQSLEGMGTGGLTSLEFKLTGVERPAPIPPEESPDMTRVEFLCHPDEPLRVLDAWEFDVACTICGTRYAVADAREREATT